MNKRQIDALIKKIDAHQKGVAKERDRIDETIDSLNSLREDCDQASEALLDAKNALENARDELSKQV